MSGPRIGSLCSGYRGLDMAVEAVFGGTTAWVSDVDPGANKILAHRWPSTPNIGDLTTTDWDQVLDQHGPIDILCGGYPCQPFSLAGELKGVADERHLWPFIARALSVLRPRVAIFENVENHLRLGFDTVLADLARLGFDAEWACVRASEIGAPHQRSRLFVYATATDAPHLRHERPWDAWGWRPGSEDGDLASTDAGGEGLEVGTVEPDRDELPPVERGRGERAGEPEWGDYEAAIRRWEEIAGRRAPRPVDDRNRLSPLFVEWLMGLPAGHVTAVPGLDRTAQIKALGNGVIPGQAAVAIHLLHARATTPAVLAPAV